MKIIISHNLYKIIAKIILYTRKKDNLLAKKKINRNFANIKRISDNERYRIDKELFAYCVLV